MKKTKSFRKGTDLETIAHFAKVATDELTGETGEPTIPATVRITVEVLKAEELAIAGVLETFELVEAKDSVERFVEYRRDEKRKPVNSLSALRRLLKPFKGRAGVLKEAIDNSIRHGWTGIFEPSGEGKPKADRSFPTEGGSSGGEW